MRTERLESVTVLRKEDYRKLCQEGPRYYLLFLFCYFLLLVFLELLADDFELRDITFDISYLDISVGVTPSCFTEIIIVRDLIITF